MVSLSTQFKLLMWKGFILRKRRLYGVAVILEILLPIVLFFLWIFLNDILTNPDTNKEQVNETYYPIETKKLPKVPVYYAPNNDLVKSIMDTVKEKYCTDCDMKACDDEDELVDEYMTGGNKDNMLSIFFNNVIKNRLPDRLIYSIRVPATTENSKSQLDYRYSDGPPLQAEGNGKYTYNPRKFNETEKFRPSTKTYWKTIYQFMFYKPYFCGLQQSVDSAFIDLKRKENNMRNTDFTITLQQFPDPEHEIVEIITLKTITLITLGIVLVYLLIFTTLLQGIMEEKCGGVKEIMKIMGMKSWMIMFGWYIYCMITSVISITICAVLVRIHFHKNHALIEHSNIFIFWLFFMLYITSGICFFFFMSALFTSSISALAVAPALWVLTILPSIAMTNIRKSLTFIRYILLLLPNTCLAKGLQTIEAYEDQDIGVQWSNLFDKPYYDDYRMKSMGLVLIMLIVDSIIYVTLSLYLDYVCPGKYGVGRTWSFPFKVSFWCTKYKKSKEDPDHYDEEHETRKVYVALEAVPDDVKTCIAINKVFKMFQGKTVVSGLNLDIYRNQLTVLLGHNGAGKTTTMNMITGMVDPTYGDILVNGYSVLTHMNQIREFIGLCPQHNINFPNLTVLEHLMFFAMLKGMTKGRAKKESLEYLHKLDMSEKADKKARTLSGGMLRRLSLGMAMVGDTKVLILDEPTSGMDPETRRLIWNMFLSIRGEKTILITTQYMEEADILGDRIAIMHSGELMCYGTSMFLKKIYGAAYIMSVVLKQDHNLDNIMAYIVTFVPNSKVKSSSESSAIIVLPTYDTQLLTTLFLDLENKKDALKIHSFGVSLTTLEEVFLEVGRIADEHEGLDQESTESESNERLLRENYNSGYILLWQQFRTLIIKRCHFLSRKKLLLLIAFIVPYIVHISILTTMQHLSTTEEIKLQLKMYSDSVTYYSYTKENFEISNYYTHVIKQEKSKDMPTSSVSETILDIAAKHIGEYKKLIVAAELNATSGSITCNAMYSRYAIHALPISINVISNALLKYYTNRSRGYSITVINKPLPSIESVNMNQSQGIMMSFGVVGLSVFFGIMLAYSVNERVNGVKHLQIMTGVSRILYWFSIYIIDITIYFFLVVIIILVSYSIDKTMGKHAIWNALLIYILYGLAALPFCYFFHYRPTTGSAINFTVTVVAFTGMGLGLFMQIWQELDNKDRTNETLIQILIYICMICPHFTFTYGYSRLANKAYEIYNWEKLSRSKKVKLCGTSAGLKRYVCCKPASNECYDFYNFYKGQQSLLIVAIFFVICIILYTVLFLFIDYGLLRRYYERYKPRKSKIRQEERKASVALDSDVMQEQRRINNIVINAERNIYLPETLDMFVVSNLRKWYGDFHAVKGVSFGVKEFECYGLLGVNGAGKTTTIKMLTGELPVSYGKAQIYEFTLLKNRVQYLKHIGYCPQFDAFNTELSTRQMLTCFANLRGIPGDDIEFEVDVWLNKLDIMEYEDIQCGKLSGGNKRKLSTAMALIGDPPLLMLDEPTSGVDPVARRNFWNILCEVRQLGQAIVFSSHSMDECEALCDRLGIMVDGQLRCIGDVQYLKNKFGLGFTLIIKLRSISKFQQRKLLNYKEAITRMKTEIQNKFECNIKDTHKGMVAYHILNQDVTIGKLFEYMEQLKTTRYIIEDYTVGCTTLEEVFLSFAKKKLAA